MGEVYEAEDLELRARVALKTIRPEVAADTESLERFRREIHLARKVTHRNVCRIFDLYRHRFSDGRELSFLAMELLSGETLSQRLKRTGRMTPDQALPLVKQMAAALQAAHRASVVHRDFKPDNVMLVEEEDGCRAVVTDFGLSRSQKLDPAAESVTGTGVFVGTPAYMSPEQVEGKEVTQAADVYALGLVLYEMVTGARPFVGTSPLVTAAARVSQPPTPPRRHVPELSETWEAVILKCLERDPERRFPTAAAVAESLWLRPESKSRRAPWLAALVALVLAAVLGVTLLPRMRPEGTTGRSLPNVSSVQPRRAVAVLGFQNLSGNPDVAWLSTALSEMLGTELSQGDGLRVVPGDRVAQMKNDLSLGESGSYDAEALRGVRTNVGADFIVFGSYVALGDEGGQLRIDLRLQDTSSAEIVGSVRDAGVMNDLFALVTRVGSSLRGHAGLETPSESPGNRTLPAHREAAKLYVEGLENYRAFKYLEAQALLERALEVEPNHPLIQTALAQVWWDLGYAGRARDLAKQAYEHSDALDLEQRLQIEALYRRYIGSTQEREKAAAIYSTLWSSFPDELDYGLLLARAQAPLEALATIEELKKLPPPAGSDPRIFLLEAYMRSEVSTVETLEAARRAASESQARNTRLTLAEARLREGTTLGQMGRDAEALQALEQAKTLFAAAANTIGIVRTLEEIAKVNRHVGPTESRKFVSEAVALAREVGALPQAGNALLWFSEVAANEGEYAEAEQMIDEAQAIWEDVGDDVDIAKTLATRSFVHYLKGDLRRAEELEHRSQERLLRVGDEETIRHSFFDLARIQFDRGDLISAEENYERALELERKLGLEGMTISDLVGLADVHGEQARFEEAVSSLEEAIRLSESTTDLRYRSDRYVELADLHRARGDNEAARRSLERIRTLHVERGEQLAVSFITAKLALLLRDLGDEQSFDRLLRDAIAKATPLLRTADAMDEPLEQLGKELVTAGAFAAAEEVYRERLAFYERRGNRYEALWMLRRIGLLNRARGEPREARRLYQEALAIEKDLSGFRDVDGLYLLAAVEEDLGNLDEARDLYREAISSSTERGLDRKAAYTELDLASVDIELGRPQGLEGKIRGVADGVRRQRSVYGQCYAGLVLARLKHTQGELEEALGLIRESLALSRQVLPSRYNVDWHKGPYIRELVSIEAARILAASGDDDEAREHLEHAKRRARQLQHVPLQLETRLAEGEIELRAGLSDAGRRNLRALREEAEAKGFVRIQRKAQALLSERSGR